MNHVFKTFTSALLGAAALASLATGCVREQFNTNPNYNPETNSVTTKFVLNVSNQTGNDTKMTAANVQANGQAFRGMQDVHILTYKLGPGNTPSFTGAPAADATIGKFFFDPATAGGATKDYNFGRLFEAGAVTGEKQSRIMELSFPLETNAIALYGKALNTKGAEHQGQITAIGDPANLASLRFALTPRVDPNAKEPYTAGAYAFQSIISSLTIAGLVNEEKYWTDDGLAYNGTTNHYLVTGNKNKQYKIWLPYEPNDPLYKKITELERYQSIAGADYKDGDAYELRDGDPTNSPYSYHLKVGNCSWKMLGDMYLADHDGDLETTASKVVLACDPHTYEDALPADIKEDLEFVPLLEALGEAYHKLITISTRVDFKYDAEGHKIPDTSTEDPNDYEKITYHELRAGSAAAILRTLRDLDFIIHKVMNATPSSWSEVIAQQLASELHDRIQVYFIGDTDDMVYREASVIRNALYSYVKDNPDALALYNDSGIASNFTNEYLQGSGSRDGTAGFPMNIGFPMGAAYLKTDAANDNTHYWKAERFLFDENIPAYAFGSTSTFNIFNYCYPAELMYYGNSPLRISDSEHVEGDFPATISQWRNEGTGTKWTSDWVKFGSVQSTTRSVAMVDHINYGSALLKSTVQYDAASVNVDQPYLEDNKGAIFEGEQPNKIRVIGDNANPVTTGIRVTGIVIGGQPAAVTWDFTRMPDLNGTNPPSYSNVHFTDGVFTGLSFENDTFGKMIYDKLDTDDQFRIGVTSENSIYTLCWDNYDALAVAADQRDVYIALELQNKTGEDFWGETNLVRKDAIFYLVGKLDLKKLIANHSGNYDALNGHLGDRSKTGYYYYPPFNPDTGETIEVPRVFMQDYMTTATLTLNKDALKHAYMSVPDLRSNQVSLGVSVDITWETGLSFEVEMGKLN